MKFHGFWGIVHGTTGWLSWILHGSLMGLWKGDSQCNVTYQWEIEHVSHGIVMEFGLLRRFVGFLRIFNGTNTCFMSFKLGFWMFFLFNYVNLIPEF